MILFLLLAVILSSCSSENRSSEKNTLRMNMIEDPTSLDPRIVHDLPSNTPLQMLYEGLFRRDQQGKPQPAIAESFSVSPDLLTYTFKLRKTTWSDGESLTAHDFVETWKSMLDPNFPSPNAYQLYAIKNGKAAKEGKIALDQVGLRVEDPYTLVIELEKPIPYFSEVITSYTYLPVHPKMRAKAADQAFSPSEFVGNGPFNLKSWQRRKELITVKNPLYWDNRNVKLEKIVVMILDPNTAFQMFMGGELDWIGSPHSFIPSDAIPMLKKRDKFFVAPSAGTHWVNFNTMNPPFDHPLMRKAFSQAIDRKAIIEHVLLGGQTPAYSLVPYSFNLSSTSDSKEYNLTSAWETFQEALREMNISKDDLPPIKLIYATTERAHKTAQVLQQQWNKAFGIQVDLASMEFKVLLDKMSQRDFQMSISGWYADYRDPINFFEIFKYRSNTSNSSAWENEEFISLIDQSDLEPNPKLRNSYLVKAEEVLIHDSPIAPVYFNAYNYTKNNNLQGVYLSDLGFLDFKEAYFSLPD